MALYAIGDVQGCCDDLRRLLDKINFDPSRDWLWFTGDLVNRGPCSAEVIRLVREFGNRAVAVLGNHDLHLLAVAEGVAALRHEDVLDDVLRAADRDALLEWLRLRPLFHHDPVAGFALVHAGLLPEWSLADAGALAREAEGVIRGERAPEFFAHMYGNKPDHWETTLDGWPRLRLIVNAFTRLRFCHPDGRIDYRHKGPPSARLAPLRPWFQVPGRRSRDTSIIFGHWSTLGRWHGDGVIGLDTGCVWGGRLTAVRLDDEEARFFSVACAE